MISRLANVLMIVVLCAGSAFGQAFEGKVTYQTSYKSKMPNVTDEQFSSMMGTTQEYFIKGGAYKTSSNGSMLQWQLYVNADNKLYSKMSNAPAVWWNDGNVSTDEVLKTEINRNATDILGYKCDEFIMTCKSGVQRYYFNHKLKVDPKSFDKHKFGNWNVYISNTGALPLKMSIDNPQFVMESVAVEVKPMKLDDEFFKLPPDIKTEKSPY
mgnify:CR=1 FL=1